MGALSLLMSLILVGQLAQGGDRYSSGAATPASAGAGGFEALAEPAGGESPPPTQVAPSPFSGSRPPLGANGSGAPSGFAPPPATVQAPAASAQPLGTYPSQGANQQAPNTAVATDRKPSAMMRALLTPPPVSRLAGQPIALAQIISGAATRQQQSERIEAYWDLCASVADYYLGLREQDELRRLRSLLGSASPSAAWQQAEAELGVRVNTSQVAALASQHRLAALMNFAGGPSAVPLPADTPHCGDYETHFERIFAGRPNAEVQQLAALLPLRYEELKNTAAAVARAEESLNVERGAADETALLQALELLALQRRAFVEIARDYNRRIARYTELATPGEIESSRLIGMLIESTTPATATRSSSATAPPNRQSSSSSRTRQTYVDGWTPVNGTRAEGEDRDEAVEQASAETQTLHKERSLLVKPR